MRATWTSTARDLVADPTREGWAALALCVLLSVGPETAFELLTDHTAPRKPPKLTPEDFMDIEELKAQGYSWSEIGAMYGREKTNIWKAYTRYMKKKER